MPARADKGARSRSITACVVSRRWGVGFSAINMRPVLAVKPLPTKDAVDSTAGSASITSVAFCWRSRIAGKETSVAPSVQAKTRPMSSGGRVPLGSVRNRCTVSPVVISTTTIDRPGRASAGRSVAA